MELRNRRRGQCSIEVSILLGTSRGEGGGITVVDPRGRWMDRCDGCIRDGNQH